MSSVRSCSSCLSVYRADFARCPIDGDIVHAGPDPLIGMTLAQHYVIDAFLGEGAMARVYRAHHALLAHKQFAVKIMIGDLAATLEMRLRFAQEANAASQLEHPNVVTAVDFGRSESGLMFMVMELVDGRTLADVIAEGPIATRRALAIARQICHGLAHAHERGLVHRDLKPENVVLSSRGRVRIVDFGLAIPVDDDRSTRLTGGGLAMGTPLYAAPEQTHALPVDHRADLFALGVTMFEMLAGRPPFEGTVYEILHHNANDVMPPLVGRNGKRVPTSVEDIVRRLMRRNPDARYANAMEVIAAIDAAQLPSRFATLPLAPIRRPASTLLGIAIAASMFATGYFIEPTSASIAAPVEPPRPTVTPIEEPAIEAAAIAWPSVPEEIAVPLAVIGHDTKPAKRVRPVRGKTRPRATANSRHVADSEFFGGPTGFAKLPQPVDADAARRTAAAK